VKREEISRKAAQREEISRKAAKTQRNPKQEIFHSDFYLCVFAALREISGKR
jgi:hypothetical protein